MNKGIQDITSTTLQRPPPVGLSIGNISTPSAISPTFSPMNIPGCKLWLDADDSYSVTLRDNPAPSAFPSVVSWRDKSNSGLDVGYDVLVNQPLYTRNSFNGRGAITFGTDSVRSVLRSAAPPVQGMTGWPMGNISIFIVYEVIRGNTSCWLFGITTGTRGILPATGSSLTGFLTNFSLVGQDSPLPTREYSSCWLGSQQTISIASPHPSYEATEYPTASIQPVRTINYLSAIIPHGNSEADYLRLAARGGEAQAVLRRNGRPGSPDRNYSSRAISSTQMPLRLMMGTNSAGTEVQGGSLFKGNIYEIAVFDRITNNGEILALEEYFRSKWCPNQPPVYLQN